MSYAVEPTQRLRSTLRGESGRFCFEIGTILGIGMIDMVGDPFLEERFYRTDGLKFTPFHFKSEICQYVNQLLVLGVMIGEGGVTPFGHCLFFLLKVNAGILFQTHKNTIHLVPLIGERRPQTEACAQSGKLFDIEEKPLMVFVESLDPDIGYREIAHVKPLGLDADGHHQPS